MRTICCTVALLGLSVSPNLFAGIDGDLLIEKRGDANQDEWVDMADAEMILDWLFEGGQEPPCLNQADANDDGAVTGADAQYLLNWLFNGGAEPPYPGPYATECVLLDEARAVGCESLPICGWPPPPSS